MDLPEIKLAPTVLMYNMKDDARTKAIRQYLRTKQIACTDVAPADYGQSLGALLHLYGFSRRFAPADLFEDEMLVLFAFENTMLDEFLKFFRVFRLRPVALKAVVTAENVKWSSSQLHAELCAERAQFEKQQADPR